MPPPNASAHARRLVASFTAALVALVVFAPVVAADGVGPTNFRSEIDAIEPETGTVDVRIVGSDSFLEVSAEPGTTVSVPGYEGEPYLRIDADGSVWRNENSPARFLNDSRSGNAPIPRDLPDPDDPDWRHLSNDGIVAWHDHRIHWMSDQVPATGSDGAVSEWQVPMTVDGVDVMVTGTLFHSGDMVPWPLIVSALAALAITGAVIRSKRHVLSTALLVASLGAVLVGLFVTLADPPDSGRSPLTLVLALAATLLSLMTLVPGGRPTMFRLVTSLGATALLVGWIIPFIGVFWMPYVPAAAPSTATTAAATAAVRLLTAYIAGTVIASVAAVALRPTVLTGDQVSGPAPLVDR